MRERYFCVPAFRAMGVLGVIVMERSLALSLVLFGAVSAMFVNGSAACAQDTRPAQTAQTQAAVPPEAAAPTADAKKEPPTGVPSINPLSTGAPSNTNSAQSTTQSQAACSAELQTPASGPLLQQRKELYDKIMKARDEGIGISAYLGAFRALEEQVGAGAAEDSIKQRLQSIASGLDDQRKRSAILKTQRPSPARGSTAGLAAEKNEFGKRSDLGDIIQNAGGAENLINKFKDKYGGQIPEGLKDKLGGLGDLDAETIKNKLQGSDAGKKILEKLAK